jgi:hypothetical protein
LPFFYFINTKSTTQYCKVEWNGFEDVAAAMSFMP